MSRFFKLAIGVLASAAVLAAACGGDDPPQQTTADDQSQQTSAQQASTDDQPQQAAADDQSQSQSQSQSQAQAQAEEPLSIVVSNGVIGDWTRQIAGDLAEIRVLTPAGADVHTIELSVSDVRAVAGADLVIMNGATLEASWQSVVEENADRVLWLAEAIEEAGNELAPFSSAMAHDDHDEHDDHGDEEEHDHEQDEEDHAHDDQDEQHEDEDHDHEQDEEDHAHDDQDEQHEDEDHDHEQDEEDHAHDDQDEQHEDEDHDHEQDEDDHAHDDQDEQHEDEDDHDAHAGHAHGSEDPHFWFDLDLASVAVRAIADELMALRPGAAASIGERLDDYLGEMADADAEAAALLAELEDGERLLVTFHDAFGYFARRYGLEVAGFLIEGPEQDVGAGQVAALIEEIEHEGVARIYREPQFDSSLIESISDQTGTEIAVIYSQPSGDVLTWTAMLLANARAVAGE